MSVAQPLLVSCIMPTADRRAHAARAVEYFLRQHHVARELVIVDDGDDPVDDLAAADPRIRYVRLAARATVGAKRNVACAASRGAIIAHWDDDDWYGAERLTRQVEYLSASGASVCGLRSLLYLSAVDGRAWRYEYPSTERPWVAGNTLCYWRRAWEEHPFAEIASGEDTRFVWSCRPADIRTLDDGCWHVGILHATNTSGVDPSGDWWRPADPAEARSRLGPDAPLYMRPYGRRPAPARTESEPARARSTQVAVVVTCHTAYLPWLKDALASIDRQQLLPAERVVVLDGCDAPPRPGWHVVVGAYGDPSPARETGLAATSAPWVVFWDADNVMASGFLASVDAAVARAAPDVAIIYPDLQLCDGALRPTALRRMPDWDYWALRAENYVDTASAWRREALALAGSWPRYVVSSHEDYALALDLTAAGWQGRPLDGPPVLMRDHGAGRNRRSMENGVDLDDIWRARTLGIVTLVAPRPDTFERWREYLQAAELPPKTSLYVVDNTGDPAFTARIYEACRALQRSRGLRSVEIVAAGVPYTSGRHGPGDGEDRHRHVARLYGSVLRRVREDLVLTLEDDVEPPLDAVRLLGRAVGWRSREAVGAVAAAYAFPGFGDLVCAGTGDEEWGDALRWDALPAAPIDVGCVGGGCTMWANWVLRDLPVQLEWSRKLGWDAVLCRELRRRNYRVKLHGGVRCVHHVHGELTATQPLPLR